MTRKLLTPQEAERLAQVDRIDVGPYETWNPIQQCPFVVELLCQPLAALIEDAASGKRVYEFMSIRRPGDVLQYLAIRLVDVGDDVKQAVASRRPTESPEVPKEIPFLEFDKCFHWDPDDTYPHHLAWLAHREGKYWSKKLDSLFEIVRGAQSRLRENDDFLLRHEIGFIDAHQHRRDYWPDWRVNPHPLPMTGWKAEDMPEYLRDVILDLIQRDDVQSVSCPFDDFVIWRALVVKQLRRSEATGLPLQEAFALCGPNAVYWQGIEDWGGKVHIPMEGACGGDLFILPEWHNFFADKVREGGKLRWAVGGKRCHRVLLRGDHGEIGCATRKTYGDWTLYTSTAPYEPCNPFVDPEMDAIIAAGPVE